MKLSRFPKWILSSCDLWAFNLTHCGLVTHYGDIFIGPSMAGAEETIDYHIYGITQNCPDPWWRHQMGTLSALLVLCMGNSPVTGEFPSPWLVTRNFDVFFDLCLNKRLSKQSRRRWFETSSWSLWRHCNDMRVSWTYRYCHLEVPLLNEIYLVFG